MNFQSTHESGIFERWTWPQITGHLIAQATHIAARRQTVGRVFPEQVKVAHYDPDTLPLRLDTGAELEAKAVCYGWEESEVTRLRSPLKSIH